MELKDFYTSVGGDYDTVLNRLPSVSLILRFGEKFLHDPSWDELHHAWKGNDVPAAFRAAHTLKGISANLGLDVLYKAASDLVEQLRITDTLPEDAALVLVDRAYHTTIESIHALLAGGDQ